MYRCVYTHMYIHVHMCIHKDMRICIHVHMNLHDGPHHTSDVPALCAILGTHMMYSHIIIFLFLRLAQVLAHGGYSMLNWAAGGRILLSECSVTNSTASN